MYSPATRRETKCNGVRLPRLPAGRQVAFAPRNDGRGETRLILGKRREGSFSSKRKIGSKSEMREKSKLKTGRPIDRIRLAGWLYFFLPISRKFRFLERASLWSIVRLEGEKN